MKRMSRITAVVSSLIFASSVYAMDLEKMMEEHEEPFDYAALMQQELPKLLSKVEKKRSDTDGFWNDPAKFGAVLNAAGIGFCIPSLVHGMIFSIISKPELKHYIAGVCLSSAVLWKLIKCLQAKNATINEGKALLSGSTVGLLLTAHLYRRLIARGS